MLKLEPKFTKRNQGECVASPKRVEELIVQALNSEDWQAFTELEKKEEDDNEIANDSSGSTEESEENPSSLRKEHDDSSSSTVDGPPPPPPNVVLRKPEPIIIMKRSPSLDNLKVLVEDLALVGLKNVGVNKKESDKVEMVERVVDNKKVVVGVGVGVVEEKVLVKEDTTSRLADSNGKLLYYSLAGTFKPHSEFVRKVKFLNNSSRYFCSGSNDGTVSVCDLDSQKVTLCFRAHPANSDLSDFSWSNTNKFLLTTSLLEKTIKIWNYQTKKKVSEITVASGITTVCYNPVKSNHFACGDIDGRLYWYSTKTLEGKQIYRDFSIFQNNSDFNAPISALAYGVDPKTKDDPNMKCWLFAGNSSGRLEVYRFLESKEQYKQVKHISQKQSITHILYSSSLKCVIVNSTDDKIKMFKFPSLELYRVFFHPHRTLPLRCCLDPEEKFIYSGSEDGHIRIFDCSSGALIKSIQVHKEPIGIPAVDLSQTGNLVSSTLAGEIHLFHNNDSHLHTIM